MAVNLYTYSLRSCIVTILTVLGPVLYQVVALQWLSSEWILQQQFLSSPMSILLFGHDCIRVAQRHGSYLGHHWHIVAKILDEHAMA